MRVKRKRSGSYQKVSLILLFILSIVIGYFLFRWYKATNTRIVTTNIVDQKAQPTEYPTDISPTHWKTYQDSVEHFSLKYPANWIVSKQGSAVNPWINISSPNNAPSGSQQSQIGMTIGLSAFHNFQTITKDDLKQLVSTEGIRKYYTVNTISENFVFIGGHQAFTYEYEGTESMYPYHFWGMNIANNSTILTINIVDFKVDKDLDSRTIAPQILSTFRFID